MTRVRTGLIESDEFTQVVHRFDVRPAAIQATVACRLKRPGKR